MTDPARIELLPFEAGSDTTMAVQNFGIGQPVTRAEDPILVRGEGRYADDNAIDGQVHAVMVRSQVAHGILRSVGTDAALAMKGVLAVYTQADLDAAGFGELAVKTPVRKPDGTPPPTRPAMAREKVRFLGEIIACVIARTPEQALDGAEAVEVDIEQLPAVTLASEADKAGAPLLFDDMPGNLLSEYRYGDPTAAEAAFARAHHVARVSLRNQRIVVNALEPRSALCTWDGKAKRWILRTASQGVKGLQANIGADLLKGHPEQVHVLTGQVGGSFGMKGAAFPEYAALMHGARSLRKPVKWTDRRSDSYVSDFHGRDDERFAELALDTRGKFLALRITGHGNLGAYPTAVGIMPSTTNVPKNINSVYDLPVLVVRSRSMVTNTVPIGPYRGAGRPEANYFMERLIDVAAAGIGIDRVTLRRRNLVKPAQLPYKAASGMVYDSGDFPGILDRALEASDWKGFGRRRTESRRRGLLRGIGLGQFLEVSAPPGRDVAGIDFNADGTITMRSGTLDFGMGHWTAFAQILVTRLGVPINRIRLMQGDSDRLPLGGGSGGSKSMQVAGQAFTRASDIVIEKGQLAAAHFLETSPGDIEFRAGRFAIAGTDRGIGLIDLAMRLRASAGSLPPDVPASLDTEHIDNGVQSTFPNGAHVAEVEIDPETGAVCLVRYIAINDIGTVVNPLLVEGQVHGGVVQAIGQALMEHTVFDDNGQLLTGSFMDYCLPRADDLPFFFSENRPMPATTNPLGIKGVGESGCAGGLTSVTNAVMDALSGYGILHIDMPLTPARVFEAMRAAAPTGTD